MSVKVDDAVDKSDDSQDVGPLQASRAWVTQAENNVIDRLVEAGLVAPLTPGGYENTVLDQIVINLQVPNNLAFTDQVHTRILLTDTVETTTVGNTILISKGLIDTLPSEEAIASVVAMELAHIVMGHHIDTRYAFNDRLLFPDTRPSSASTCTTRTTTISRPPRRPWSTCRTPCTKTSFPRLGSTMRSWLTGKRS